MHQRAGGGEPAPTSARMSAASSTGCSASSCPTAAGTARPPNGSTRSSFNTTICVLEALLEHERAAGASPEVTEARLRGQEYLLERRLFRRRSTGEVIEQRSQGRRRVDALRLPDVVALRRAAGARVPAQRRRHARRARGRGDRAGRVEARRRRAVAARDPVPRRDAGRDGRGRGPAEPVEHPPRLTSVGLVFSTRLTQMPLEGDWQRAELARSVTLPILRWPNNRLQRTAVNAASLNTWRKRSSWAIKWSAVRTAIIAWGSRCRRWIAANPMAGAVPRPIGSRIKLVTGRSGTWRLTVDFVLRMSPHKYAPGEIEA